MNVYSITCHKNTQKLSLGSCDIFPKELNLNFNKTMPKKMTKEEFIAKAEARYGKGKYNYDGVDYQGNKNKVKIFCNNCNSFFYIRPNDFLSGIECKCANNKYQYHNKETFIQKAIQLYGKDKYSFNEVVYINSKTPVKIFCNRCKSYFWKTPYHFLHGSECDCYRRITTETFIKRAEDIYGVGRYGYQESVYVNNKTLVKIFCPECNKYFYKTPHAFIDGNLGCPGCFHNLHESKGESIVKRVLEELDFEFDQEYYIGGCIQGRNTKSLRIDFRLQTTTKEIWIEYNGKQHYIENDYFNKEDPDWFKKQLIRDKNVRKYCEENDILLIEIPYTYITLDKIRTVLSDILINHKSPEEIITYPEIIPLDNKT